MIVVPLEESETDLYINFRNSAELNECGRVISSQKIEHPRGAQGELSKGHYFVAKDDQGQWLGTSSWSPLGDHQAKIFPIQRDKVAAKNEQVSAEVTEMLLGKTLFEILENPKFNLVITRPFAEQIDAAYHASLCNMGFRLLVSRVEFKTLVSELPSALPNLIDWRPILHEEDLTAAAAVFKDAAEGDPHSLDVAKNALGCIKEALSETNLTTDLEGIQIGYINNVPMAYLHVQIQPATGWSRITYMGLVKEFRGKGLGQQLHNRAFSVIRQFGGILYHGGTSVENKSMLALFEKSNCSKYAQMQEWQFNLHELRANARQEQLTTSRLILEPMVTHHAKRCYKPFQDSRIYAYIKRAPPTEFEKFYEGFAFLERRLSPDLKEFWWNWVCIEKATRDIVGTIEVTYIRASQEVHLAYTVFPKYWKMGYAKEACRNVIEYLFAQKNATKIIIEMDTENKASVALAESLGAKRVSYNEKVQLLHGNWSNEYRYELTDRKN